jgi:hypothetical protein
MYDLMVKLHLAAKIVVADVAADTEQRYMCILIKLQE